MLKKLRKPQTILLIILAVALFLRVFRIDYPNKYVFDEVYHGFTAQEYLKGNKDAWIYWSSAPQGVAYEWTHPPLAKEIMAISMAILQKSDPWAYRLPGALLGVLSVFMIYLITKELFKKEQIALLAALIFSLDGLNFVQSRTGMNDIYLVTFMLVSFYFFLRKSYIFSAVFLGLAAASKWTALYYFGFIMGLLILQKVFDLFKTKKLFKSPFVLIVSTLMLIAIGLILFKSQLIVQGALYVFESYNHLAVVYVIAAVVLLGVPHLRKIGYFVLIPTLIYFLSYYPLFTYNYTDIRPNEPNFKHFVDLQKQMWWYHTGLKATHDYTSRWWTWPFNLHPVWYDVQYINPPTPEPGSAEALAAAQGTPKNQLAVIFAAGNPIVFLMGFIAIVLSVLQLIDNKKVQTGVLVVVSLFALSLIGYTLFPTHPLYTAINTALKEPLQHIPLFTTNNDLPSSLFLVFCLLSAVTAVYGIYKRKHLSIALALLGYLAFLLPWSNSPRIMFFYHYSPSVIFLSILLAYQVYSLTLAQKATRAYYTLIGLIIFGFVIIFPFISAIPFQQTINLSWINERYHSFATVELFFMTNKGKNPWRANP